MAAYFQWRWVILLFAVLQIRAQGGAPTFTSPLPAESFGAYATVFRLEVAASGAIQFQWYKKNPDGTFGTILNASTNDLVFDRILASDAGIYRVIASNSAGSATNETVLAIIYAPLLTQPEEQRVSAGAALTLQVTILGGTEPIYCQWFKDNNPIDLATNRTYQKTAAVQDTGNYFLRAWNLAAATNTQTVSVLVSEGAVAPWFRARNQPPPSRTLATGATLSLSAQADGAAPLSYFWFKNEIPAGQNASSFNKTSTTTADSGSYYLLASNSVGTARSSMVEVTVLPPDETPIFASASAEAYFAEGTPATLTFTFTQGSNLAFQWYRRSPNNFGSGAALAGQTNQSLVLTDITEADWASFGLKATNSKGSAIKWVELIPILAPAFSGPPGGYEGPAGGRVELSATAGLSRGNEFTSIKWYKDGILIPDPPNSFTGVRNFNASPQTTGSYFVIVSNIAGQATSPAGRVTLRDITPATGPWTLVANTNTAMPGLGGDRFAFFRGPKLKAGAVTFLGCRAYFYNVTGMYRWQNEALNKIADFNDVIPPFTVRPWSFLGPSELEAGALSFTLLTTNLVQPKNGVMAWQNGSFQAIATSQTPMPGRASLNFSEFGSPARAQGKTAFLAVGYMQIGAYYGVFVWDGTTLSNWANSDQPFPVAGSSWNWQSGDSEIAFDGTTAAFQNSGGKGLFKTVNASPLQKIAFLGDPIPGGLGTFKSILSPPTIQNGKVLFLAEANEFAGRVLVEESANGLRLIAKPRDTPSGVREFDSLNPGFDYADDASILFSAAGPGTKQGIYRWRNGLITEELSTLNTLFGQRLNAVALADADGFDKLAALSFTGANGLYASLLPRLNYSITGTGITLNRAANQTIQHSTNLVDWFDLNLQTTSTVISPSENTLKFYRLIQP